MTLRRTPLSRATALAAMLAVLLAVAFLTLASVARAADRPEYGATYVDGHGAFTLEDLRGEVVLLNVWATWCEPCKREIPALSGIAADYAGADLHLIGVSIDRTQSDGQIASFARDLGATYTIARDPDNTFASVFRTTGVPVTVLIDRSGQVVRQWPGDIQEHLPDLRAAIDSALAASGEVDTGSLPALTTVGFAAAFGAGMLSVLSPCVLPLLPTYAAYITGVSVDEMVRQQGVAQRRRRVTTLRNGLLFVLGFSLVFIALGASASVFGSWLYDWRIWLARIGGVILLAMGVHMLGLVRIPWLDRTSRPMLDRVAPSGAARPIGSVLVGMAFGAGWTPCIGPVLASILALAAASASVSEGVALLAVYSLGLAVPFLLGTVLLDRYMQTRPAFGRWLPRIERASAVLVIIIGVLMLTGVFSDLARWTGGFAALG